MKRIIYTLLLLCWPVSALFALQAGSNIKQPTIHDDVLVGVNYFSGWWRPSPNRWEYGSKDWRLSYPDRIPLLGDYNNQATMNREIIAAAEHGVDFFAILWYYQDPGTERQVNPRLNSRYLNRGLDLFLKSPEARRMKFIIEFCNHPPFEVTTDEQWDSCINVWIKAMRHPSYLRIDNKLLFKVHGAHHMYHQNHKSITRCREMLNHLRNRVRQAGLGEMFIGGGVGGGGIQGVGPAPVSNDPCDANHWLKEVFDFTATYMAVPDTVEPAKQDYSYDVLAEFIRLWRNKNRTSAVPYIPFISAGWNPRPLHDSRPRFVFPTRDQWLRELRQIKRDLGECKNFGLPLSNNKRQKMFTIYSWNEFGEGGIVAPTQGDGFMKLEAIKQVFAALPNEQRDTLENTFERRN